MESTEIKQLLTAPKLSEMPIQQVRSHVLGVILKAYTLTGLSKTYSPDQLKEEVGVIMGEIIKDFNRETDLRTLRLPEVDYAICAGIKGEFSDVKTFGINYQTIYKWIKTYTNSYERKQAADSLAQEKQLKQLVSQTELSPSEQRQIIVDSINETYREYVVNSELRNSFSQSNASLPRNVKNIGQILDIVGAKDRLLTSEGIKPKNMPLNAFFEKCRKEGLKEVIK